MQPSSGKPCDSASAWHVVAPNRSNSGRPAPATAGRTAPLRVLVVEDDVIIGLGLAQMLGDLGFEVCAIETTEAGAVAAASRCKPDLMIVDAHLDPGNSGVAAVESILQGGPTPYLFISGGRVPESRPGAIVLQKPFFESNLTEAIQRALETAAPAVERMASRTP